MIENFLGVFALAIIEMWAAIPLGFHLKLHPVLLALATMAGAFAGAFAAIYLGNGLRRLMFWRKKEKTEEGRVSRWLIAKGPWAIGLLGPVLLGPTIAAGLAGAIGLPRAKSLALLGAGIVLWTGGLVAAGSFGLAVVG